MQGNGRVNEETRRTEIAIEEEVQTLGKETKEDRDKRQRLRYTYIHAYTHA